MANDERGGVDALVGQVVEERFLVEEQLGAGAMGTVYRARHVKVGREVALKVLHADLVREPGMVDRFEREAHAAARLSHKNLVGVLDIGMTPSGQHCMVLELAPGIGLADLLAHEPISVERAVDLIAQLLRGLEYAHVRGLVHRDLKPQNIIVEIDSRSGEWTARIVDFGIAVLRDAGAAKLTQVGMVLGTPHYMAPEQVLGKPLDGRCDLFALGMIAYELLSGALPFDGDGVDVVRTIVSCDVPTFAERTGAVVDPALEAFVRKLLARRIENRFASATEALAVLTAITGGAPIAYPPRKLARGSIPLPTIPLPRVSR